MIKVYFDRDAEGRIVAFEAEGHALYARAGQDIVCSAISALLQNAVVGIKEQLGLEISLKKTKGCLKVSIRGFDGKEKEAEAILETTVLSLQAIAEEERYKDYIRVYENEGARGIL